MIVSFKHKGLKNFFINGDASKVNFDHVKKLRLILAQLHASKEIKDMAFPGSNLHSLAGSLKGYWSVSVSGNWRIIFKFQDGKASLIDYLDYH